MKERKFEHGEIVATAAVCDRMKGDDKFASFFRECLINHICGDWGELCEEDIALNEAALKSGSGRLFSSYIYKDTNEQLWAITEADRSVTTLLFPSDY